MSSTGSLTITLSFFDQLKMTFVDLRHPVVAVIRIILHIDNAVASFLLINDIP